MHFLVAINHLLVGYHVAMAHSTRQEYSGCSSLELALYSRRCLAFGQAPPHSFLHSRPTCLSDPEDHLQCSTTARFARIIYVEVSVEGDVQRPRCPSPLLEKSPLLATSLI